MTDSSIVSDDKIRTARRRPLPTLARMLARDWQRLRTDPAALRLASRWGLCGDRMADLDEMLTAIGFEVPTATATDARLRRLVELAGTDDLAGRVVVQRLLPGLVARAYRRRGPIDEVFGELLGQLWIGIRTFNPDRRPASLAAALLADADYRAFRMAWRRRSFDIVGDGVLATVADLAPLTARDDLDLLLERAVRHGLGDADAALLRAIADDRTSEEIAAELRVTSRTIRNRRAKATDELRRLVA